jgi:hypothetical protein
LIGRFWYLVLSKTFWNRPIVSWLFFIIVVIIITTVTYHQHNNPYVWIIWSKDTSFTTTSPQVLHGTKSLYNHPKFGLFQVFEI